jgi:hypothetical protein
VLEIFQAFFCQARRFSQRIPGGYEQGKQRSMADKGAEKAQQIFLRQVLTTSKKFETSSRFKTEAITSYSERKKLIVVK